MFMKIHLVDGEAQVSKPKRAMDALSSFLGTSNAGSVHNGSVGRAGRANVHDLASRKRVGTATPKLAPQHFLQASSVTIAKNRHRF